MNVSKHSLSRILWEDLYFSAYRHCVSHLLDARLKKIHYERCKKLLKRFQKTRATKSCLPVKRFLISRRNSITKTVYRPNVVTRSKTKSQRFREVVTPLLVRFLWWVLYSGTTQINFCGTGIKMNGQIYRAMLNDALLLLKETVFVDNDEWCFQQDSALTHKAEKIWK